MEHLESEPFTIRMSRIGLLFALANKNIILCNVDLIEIMNYPLWVYVRIIASGSSVQEKQH